MIRRLKTAITGGDGCVIMSMAVIFLVSVMGLTAFVLSGRPSDGFWPAVESPNHQVEAEADDDDGLIPSGFDEKSCMSRHESLLYRRRRLGRASPSPSLISKLRSYEARHKRCGPLTESYNNTLVQQHLKSDCRYVVWMPFNGLGNRIMSLASAFLYALLTDRVLLLQPATDMIDLFCEPFPEASWLLPSDFPFIPADSNHTYDNLLRTNSNQIYLTLFGNTENVDKSFFCDQDQPHLHKIPWLILRSDMYFVPFLFSMPSFQQELHTLFPDKETVFHLLVRYLLHPANSVWGLVSRYYQAYLSKADETVGIQIRVYDDTTGPLKDILDQILSCTTRENILPEISQQEGGVRKQQKKRISVLFTSLTSSYSDRVRDLYWENPTATGEVVAVFQPTHEGHQHFGEQSHNQRAWAEVYLLSLTDKLVTSVWSTFGYVAQGLAGVKPWMLWMQYRPDNQPENQMPDPPCQRAVSMEPCFHFPPYLDCRTRGGGGGADLEPHVVPCEEYRWGIKLVNNKTEF